MGTGTRVEHEVIHGLYACCRTKPSPAPWTHNLHAGRRRNLRREERAFASKIRRSLGVTPRLESSGRRSALIAWNARPAARPTSADMSWVVPTGGMGAATWVPGTAAHSWQAVAAGGTTIGLKGMLVAAKTLALTAMDVFRDPAIAARAKEELLKKRGSDFRYESLVGDREPPLDYRK
jgi:aminobenzoyl-glutamate utilization protein B